MIQRLKAKNDSRFVSNPFDMLYLSLAYLFFFIIHLFIIFFIFFIFFYTPTCSDENVLRNFGNNKAQSESIHGFLILFPHFFFFFFKFNNFNILNNKKKKKKKKKRLPCQEYIRNKKEKLLNKRSKLVSAADILD